MEAVMSSARKERCVSGLEDGKDSRLRKRLLVRGPFDEKLRSPKLVRTRDWMYRCVARTVLLMSVGTTVSARYDGYWPVCTMCIKIHTLYLTRNLTGSQWRSFNACVRDVVVFPTALHCSGHSEELILLTLAAQIRQCCSSPIWTAPDYKPVAFGLFVAVYNLQCTGTVCVRRPPDAPLLTIQFMCIYGRCVMSSQTGTVRYARAHNCHTASPGQWQLFRGVAYICYSSFYRDFSLDDDMTVRLLCMRTLTVSIL